MLEGSRRLLTNGIWDSEWKAEMPPTVYAADFQSDGKIIVVGRFFTGGNLSGVARLNVDGSVDSTFRPPPMSVHDIKAVRLLPDDRILMAGQFGPFGQSRQFGLMRLQPNGAIDQTFSPDPMMRGFLSHLELQPDGRFFVVGYLSVPGLDVNLVRFHPDGSADWNFAPISMAGKLVTAIKLQPDGRLLVARAGNPAGEGLLFRLEPDGSLDPSFKVLLNASGQINQIALHQDGRIVAGGAFTIEGRRNLVRLHSDGALDSGFDPGSGPSEAVADLAINHHGQIAIVGWFVAVNNVPSRFFAVIHSEVPLRFAPAKGTRLLLNGYPGQSFTLEHSSDLKTWTEGPSYTFQSYTYTLQDPPNKPFFLRARGD